ncbi:MAG: beta-ketoacyl-[acyl-carrier-protein] synthase family protein [Proteobacteria bacterium]|nr:beta-ketoacyl-[acyl-carrier-protein] synthase family protein [Pseudomonadota bacterium]
MKHRVVITGLGTISGLGLNKQDFWNELIAGHPAIKPIPAIENVHISIGAMVEEFDDSLYFEKSDLPLLDRHSKFAVIAAREAVADAGLSVEDDALQRAAVLVGTGCGGKHTDEETYDQLYKQQRKRAHPLTIPKGMPSASASMVSKHLGSRGPAFVISSACASGAHAIIQAYSMIRSGIADVVITGAADAPFTYGLLKSWESLKITSSDTCRPFSKDRSGIVLGEGAGMLVLESEAHALAREADIYAEIAGVGMSSDAGHITRPDIDGIKTAIRNALDDAGIEPGDVDYINAHGTATMLNDVSETQAIRQVFGVDADSLAVSSTKSMHGHALGASSALELVATALAVKNGVIPPTANFTEADENCDLDYVPNHSIRKNIKVALSNSFAFGGLNAVIALKRYP